MCKPNQLVVFPNLIYIYIYRVLSQLFVKPFILKPQTRIYEESIKKTNKNPKPESYQQPPIYTYFEGRFPYCKPQAYLFLIGSDCRKKQKANCQNKNQEVSQENPNGKLLG